MVVVVFVLFLLGKQTLIKTSEVFFSLYNINDECDSDRQTVCNAHADEGGLGQESNIPHQPARLKCL